MREYKFPFKLLKGASLKDAVRAGKEQKLRALVAEMRKISKRPAGWDIALALNTETLEPRLSVRVPLAVKKWVWRDAYTWLHRCAVMVCDWQKSEKMTMGDAVTKYILWIPGWTWSENAAWMNRETGKPVDPDTLRRRVAREKARWRKENPIEKIEYVVGGERYLVAKLTHDKANDSWSGTFADSVTTEPLAGGRIEVTRGRRK